MITKTLVLLFAVNVLGILTSCSYQEVDSVQNNKALCEILLSNEEKQSELIRHEISLTAGSYILVSSTYLDTVLLLDETENKFEKLLLIVYDFSEDLDHNLLGGMKKEYDSLSDYLSFYEDKMFLTSTFKETMNALEIQSDSISKRIMIKMLYNELLTQELSIMKFKYDSLLFESHDALVGSGQHPYSSSFIRNRIVPNEERHSAHPTEE